MSAPVIQGTRRTFRWEWALWQPGVEFVSLVGEGLARQGSRISQVRIMMGRRTEIGLAITRLVPPSWPLWPPARVQRPRCGRPTGCSRTLTAAAWSSGSPPWWPAASRRAGRRKQAPMAQQLRTLKAGDR